MPYRLSMHADGGHVRGAHAGIDKQRVDRNCIRLHELVCSKRTSLKFIFPC